MWPFTTTKRMVCHICIYTLVALFPSIHPSILPSLLHPPLTKALVLRLSYVMAHYGHTSIRYLFRFGLNSLGFHRCLNTICIPNLWHACHAFMHWALSFSPLH